jgi:hypothetical protein
MLTWAGEQNRHHLSRIAPAVTHIENNIEKPLSVGLDLGSPKALSSNVSAAASTTLLTFTTTSSKRCPLLLIWPKQLAQCAPLKLPGTHLGPDTAHC